MWQQTLFEINRLKDKRRQLKVELDTLLRKDDKFGTALILLFLFSLLLVLPFRLANNNKIGELSLQITKLEQELDDLRWDFDNE